MDLFVTLMKGTVRALLSALSLCMLLRAILSWFLDEGSAVLNFVTMITEPLVVPFRALFDKFGWFRNTPIDVAFFAAFMLLQIVNTFV